MIQADLTPVFPLTFLVIWACVLLLVDLYIPKDRKSITALLSAVGLALTLSFTLIQIGQEEITSFNDMVVLDGFSIFVNALLLISGLLGIGLSFDYIKRMNLERGEYYTLMIFSITGMMLMAQAGDLIVVFLAGVGYFDTIICIIIYIVGWRIAGKKAIKGISKTITIIICVP